jgi:hypothetical protein
MLLVKIIQRAKDLMARGEDINAATTNLDFFLKNPESNRWIKLHLERFCSLDDFDVMTTIKNWSRHPDKILSTLCRGLVDRRLFKIKLQATPFDEALLAEKKKKVKEELQITDADTKYFVFTGEASNTTYDPSDERIHILFKDGSVKDISQIDNALIHQQLSGPVRKHYFCYYRNQ